MSICKNCQTELQGKFCHVCGQKDIPAGITFSQTVSDFVSYNFSVDGPVGTTLRALIVNPGRLIRDFIGGKRKPYYRPVQFFIVSTLIYIAIREWIGYDPLQGRFPDEYRGDNVPVYVQQLREAAKIMVANLSNMLFFLVLSSGIVLKLAGWRKYRFAEYLVSGFYVSGIYILFGVIDPVLSFWSVELGWLKFLIFIGYFAYVYWSMRGGFKVGRLIGGMALAIFSLILYMIMGFGTSFVIAVLR